MRNAFFNFKQFTILQDKCSMKVCTDSCVFGAWVANTTEQLCPEQILDIGTGTGLLSLMLAQKSNGRITAVELDENASLQATQNFRCSPWASRLTIINADVKNWNAPTQFDLIISNTPFYENDLLPPNSSKKNSKHSSGLNLSEVATTAAKLLKKDGAFAVLLPFSRMLYFQTEAKKSGLFVTEKLLVRQSTSHPYFRTILMLKKKEEKLVRESELAIKDEENNYTDAFTGLLKDYYLNL